MEAYSDIASILSGQAARRGTAVAIEAPGMTPMSYESLYEKVNGIAAGLRTFDITRSSRVAIVFPNGPEMATALLGVCCTAIAVPLNPACQRTEFRSYFLETKVDFLLVPQGARTPARDVAEETGIHVLELSGDGETITSMSAHGMDTSTRPSISKVSSGCLPNPEDTALILLTSGSTGRSKKVPLTHRNICVSVADICRTLDLNSDDSCLCMWEQFHIGGMVDLLLAPLASGGRVVCAGGFSAGRFYELLDSYAPTWFQGVPATLNELLVLAGRKKIQAGRRSLRFIRSVAAALPPSLMERVERQFDVPVIQTFGMTEAGPLITTNPLPPGTRKPGSVGKACGPCVELMAVDETGKPLATGECGEIVVRGPNVISGYEDNPEANAHSFRGGWFHTGDTGCFDEEGYLFLKGRLKEMINRGGEKITPQEIDDVLLAHPAIAQAASFSIPHPTLGEEVGAAIVLRSGHSLTESAVREYVGGVLSDFKVPRKILFQETLPRCPIGKVRRRELADIAVARGSRTGYVAARNRLESFLVEIWEEELAVEGIGIDDDFSELGGDSLSSVRLVLAIESLLRIRLPESALPAMQTVRQMAEYIEGNNGERLKLAYAPDGILGVGQSQATVRPLLAAIASGRLNANGQGELGSVQDILQRLGKCKSRREIRAIVKSLEGYLTPAEILALTSAHWPPFLSLAPRHLKFRAWKRETAKNVVSFAGTMVWKRQTIAESAHLYTASQAPGQNKTLIVAFTGQGLVLGMPMWLFLSHLEAGPYDVLYLWDPNRNRYMHGLPGLGEDMFTLNSWLGNFAARGGYREVFGFGMSGGGLPAICAALANGWSRCISVAPDSVTKYPRIEHFLRNHAPAPDQPAATELRVVYGGACQQDILHAEELARVIPIHKVPVGSIERHFVLWDVYQQGGLRALLKDCFESSPNVDVIEASNRKRIKRAFAPGGILGDGAQSLATVRPLLAAIGSDDDILQRLRNCRSKREVKAFLKSLGGYLTPAELLAVTSLPWPPPLLLTPRHLKFRDWKKRNSRKIASYAGAMVWKRKRIFESAHLYTASDDPVSEKTLIVAFANQALNLSIPVWLFLSHLETGPYDILYLCDSSRNRYMHGLPGLGEDMFTLNSWLGDFTKRAGYRAIIGFGPSAGGLPAICAALANGWSRCISVAPDSVTKYPRIEHFLRNHAPAPDQPAATELRVVYGGACQQDILHAEELARVIPIHKVPVGSIEHHGVLWRVCNQGGLGALLKDCFEISPRSRA